MKPIFFAGALLISSLPMLGSDFNLSADGSTVSFSDKEYSLSPTTLLLSSEKWNSPYIYTDPVEALKAVNQSNAANVTLLVSPSVYWLDNPDDPAIRRNPGNSGSVPYAFEINCDTLSIVGLADNPEDVVFAVNRGQTQGALGNYTMLHFKGKSLNVENMTFGNYCNVDLVYPRDHSLDRKKRREAIVQAQIGICEDTDRLFADNCRFISRLNLCPFVGARRSLYKDCYFECTDDALTGSAVYLDCKFTFYSGKPFYSTASTGAVFLNCDIHTLVDGTQYLTKVPGQVTMIDTRFTSDSPVKLQWTRDLSAKRCYQSNISLNGRPVSIDSERPEMSADISSSQLLKAYKITYGDKVIYNTPNLLAGDDGWDPLGMLPSVKEAENGLSTKLLGLPVALQVRTSRKTMAPQADTINLMPSLRLWGDYPAQLRTNGLFWSSPNTLSIEANGFKGVATSANNFPREIENIVSATTPDGLVGAVSVKIAPYLKKAPQFAIVPSISHNKTKSLLTLDYKLDNESNENSYIVWYRSTKADLSDSIAVRHGHGAAARSYPLSCADKGYYISASVAPKLTDSEQGKAAVTSLGKSVNTLMVIATPKKEKNLSTSFAEIPIRHGAAGRQGFWNFDTYKPADTKQHDWTPEQDKSWYYGQGVDAATGTGLVQATRGARLSYTPFRDDSKTMRISFVAEPSKGPGQGFGSATGQYMDVCIKFDPVTLSGYALRIERTPDYDKAVTFTLVRYDNGTVTPVSKPVASNCFRNPCNISVELSKESFTATASTDAPAAPVSNSDIKPSVSLSAIVTPTPTSSFAIQHTGSVGGSATLIRDLRLEWE